MRCLICGTELTSAGRLKCDSSRTYIPEVITYDMNGIIIKREPAKWIINGYEFPADYIKR